MTVRLIFGLGWSLVAGLAGGWLVLAPWALGEQGAGEWTTITRNELFTGAGLIVLALAGIVVVIAQSARSLRDAGALPDARAAAGDALTSSPEMEKALIALAQELADDLDIQLDAPAPAPAAAGKARQRTA
jgi:hypothetical protein